jgi:hypothetical protein
VLTLREFLIDGKTWNKASTDSPVFSWTTEGSEIPSAYRIQVSSTPLFDNLFWDTGKTESTRNSVRYGHGEFALRPVALRHGIFYVRLTIFRPGESLSQESILAVNQAPSSPVLTAPSGEKSRGAVVVKWAASSDADGDEINYFIELCENSSLGTEWKRIEVPKFSDQLSCEIDTSSLPASNDYGVRVIATDGFCESEPSNVGVFSYKPIPVIPKIIRPKAGERFNRIAEVEWESSDSDSYFMVEHYSGVEWEKVSLYPPGTRKATYSNVRSGDNCKVRITAIGSDSERSLSSVSDVFSFYTEASITAMESVGKKLLLGTSDGRILSTNEEIWDEEVISSPQTINTINPLEK